jgi:hypothetical protein
VLSASSTSSSRASGRFLGRVLVAVLISLSVWTACTWIFLRGETDDAYLRVSSPRQRSLILGTSRASQGIVPSEFDARTLGIAGPVFNFAFTSATSPWGPSYLRAIEMKLDQQAAGGPGLFVLEVSPLSLTVKRGEAMREDASFLGKLHSFASNPNIEFPLYRPERGVDILEGLLQIARGNVRKRLHSDGWLEITLPDTTVDRFRARLRMKVAENRASFASAEFSPTRLQYLVKTIGLLQQRGRVVLTRLPVHPDILTVEEQQMPGFTRQMRDIAEAAGVAYVDLTDLSPDVATTDGSHLAKQSSRRVTGELLARLSR